MGVRIWRAAGAVMMAGLALDGLAASGRAGAQTAQPDLDQGWGVAEKQVWYGTSQGSRLIPYAWLAALEAPDGQHAFLDEAYFSRFHYLPARLDAHGRKLPPGFVTDTTPPERLTRTNLQWKAGQGPQEPWVGMNCSACHTAQITYRDPKTQAATTVPVEGGPTGADFQGFISELNSALNLTLAPPASEPDRFDKFAVAVLGGDDSANNRALLKTALTALVARQNETAAQNRLPDGYHYGFGRLDAIGNIYNKVVIAASTAPTPAAPNAPVSYPFLWNVPQHDFVQWDGIAPNDNQALLPLLRNGGEVIGVFADIQLSGPDLLGFSSRYKSSVNAPGLMALEATLHTLKPPKWPDAFGAPDKAQVNQGQKLYAKNCQSCHNLLPGGIDDLNSQITAQMSSLGGAKPIGTDIWMACNAFTRRADPAVLTGTRYSLNDKLKQPAFVSDMLLVTVVGALLGQDAEVIQGLNQDLLDKLTHNKLGQAHVNPSFLAGLFSPAPPPPPADPAQLPTYCTTAKSRLLAYKGRPLYGVWATSPYLHNGSVRTLWELLEPPAKRATHFWTGSREFDPDWVGFKDQPADANDIEFNVFDKQGQPIPGNSNAGHDYGNAQFSDPDRAAIIAYIKAGLPAKPVS
jgi:mono/diheme cytochrome c family protein